LVRFSGQSQFNELVPAECGNSHRRIVFQPLDEPICITTRAYDLLINHDYQVVRPQTGGGGR
jgi:hypothetical protein